MKTGDDIRPPAAVEVQCAGIDDKTGERCGWFFWIAGDTYLAKPEGWLCETHDPERWKATGKKAP